MIRVGLNLLCALILFKAAEGWAEALPAASQLIESLSISDLMQIEVSSVSRKSQTLANTAAAAFVITQEDIHRMGATTIPDALRFAPGLEVAQIGAHNWAVSARGFNGFYANKLLVLMDGRTVYTPLFSGVFWELQNTIMEDIERIEVIRGPGAAMWGANAVNGVINIITKKAKDTRGDLAVAGMGNQERGFAEYRHGGSIGEDDSYRIYGKVFSREAAVDATGQRQSDSWRSGQLGFRMDRRLSNDDRLTVQGDSYTLRSGNPLISNAVFTPPYTLFAVHDDQSNGGNVLGRWERTLSDGSEASLQGYYDRVQINSLMFSTSMKTVDLDFQHRLHPSTQHDLMWGINYRHLDSAIGNTADIAYSPATIGYHNYSVFAQDDISLVAERLRLTLGAKEENNYFGGMQFQPNVRLLWTPDHKNTLWLAASGASRTPALGEEQSTLALNMMPPSAQTGGLPVQTLLTGNSALKAEKVKSYEAGYRTLWNPRLSSDITIFSQHYSNLIQWAFVNPYPFINTDSSGNPIVAMTPSPHLVIPMMFSNAAATSQSYGLEMSANWHVLEWMRMEGGMTYIKLSAPAWDGVNYDQANIVPRSQAFLRCLMELNERTQFDFALRHAGNLPATTQGIAAYNAVDARLSYSPYKKIEFSLTGSNLFQAQHGEFTMINSPAKQIPRSIFATVSWHR